LGVWEVEGHSQPPANRFYCSCHLRQFSAAIIYCLFFKSLREEDNLQQSNKKQSLKSKLHLQSIACSIAKAR